MAKILVETEKLREVSSFLENQALDLIESEAQVRRAVVNLEIAWQGASAQRFNEELLAVYKTLQNRTDELYSFIVTLLRQADRWDESDQNWQSQFEELRASIESFGG